LITGGEILNTSSVLCQQLFVWRRALSFLHGTICRYIARYYTFSTCPAQIVGFFKYEFRGIPTPE
jgi:hypothetical protein